MNKIIKTAFFIIGIVILIAGTVISFTKNDYLLIASSFIPAIIFSIVFYSHIKEMKNESKTLSKERHDASLEVKPLDINADLDDNDKKAQQEILNFSRKSSMEESNAESVLEKDKSGLTKEKQTEILFDNTNIKTYIPFLENLLTIINERTLYETQILIDKFEEFTNTNRELNTKILKVLDDFVGRKMEHKSDNVSFKKIIEETSQKLTEMNSVFENMAHSTKSAERQINNIEEKINNTHNFTKEIEDIAEISSVLAINASIEAAKYGERGRGFAVIAKNIRKLADDSKKSVNTIRELVNEAFEALSILKNEYGQIIKSLYNQINKSKDELEDISNTLSISYLRIESNLSFLAASIRESEISLSEVPVVLQFQDAVSQKIDHVITILAYVKNNVDSIFNDLDLKEKDIDKETLTNIVENILEKILKDVTMESERQALKKTAEEEFNLSKDLLERLFNDESVIQNKTKEIMGEDLSDDSIILF